MTLAQFLEYVKFALEEAIVDVVPVDNGTLKGSIKVYVDGEGLKVEMLDYWKHVEFGTKSMIAAHGEHDPNNPITTWKAQRERQAVGQTMPFLRNTLYHKLPSILQDGASRYLPGSNVELSFA